jgi:hypothetical protein
VIPEGTLEDVVDSSFYVFISSLIVRFLLGKEGVRNTVPRACFALADDPPYVIYLSYCHGNVFKRKLHHTTLMFRSKRLIVCVLSPEVISDRLNHLSSNYGCTWPVRVPYSGYDRLLLLST